MENTFRDRKAKYRKSHKTFSLSFSLEKAKALNEEAKKYDKTPPELIKSLVDACLHGTGYIVPKESTLRELLLALRRIGNNINQLTRHVHSEGVITHNDIERLQTQLKELEGKLLSALTLPPTIHELLVEYLLDYPEQLQSLIQWLNQHHYDNKGSSH